MFGLDGRMELEQAVEGRDGIAALDVRCLRTGVHVLEILPVAGEVRRERFMLDR